MLSNEGNNMHEVWEEMKQEIQLQADRYDDNQTQQKKKQLEQQISYLTGKHDLT
ncbi:hypothetical protein B7P43_G08917 [Cryptotermes secundus]|uniref:Uncharacterized protein n=1 Tax=Cryptotermes secundus TaxID=105785 RepID=A0A2J7QTD5_9NEOP|nr:hypothetical protein B7P43_G08917 [Cryptotermes secundus]